MASSVTEEDIKKLREARYRIADYGLDFHDLDPDSILHISLFIVVCEAFLRITPHFGSWLKTFNVKPKTIDG